MRASQVTLASKCRKSPSVNTGFGSEASNMGNAFHEVARKKILLQDPDYQSVKLRFGLTDEQVNSIKEAIYKIDLNVPSDAMLFVDDHSLKYTDPMTGAEFTGTPDFAIIEVAKLMCTAVDWKSGWADQEDPETNPQTLTYLILLLKELENRGIILEHFYVLIVLPRLGSIKTAYFTRQMLLDRLQDLIKIEQESKSPNAQYTTGSHCQSCFGCMGCPAFAGEVVKFCNHIEQRNLIDAKEVLTAMIPFGKAMVTVAGKIDKVAKAYVDQFGPLDLGGGITYAKYIEDRDEVVVDKAIPVLETFGIPTSNVISISKTAIEEEAKAKGRGVYGKVYSQLLDKGAIIKKPMQVYRIKKGANHDNNSNIAVSSQI